MTVTVTIVIVSHTPPTCVGHHQNLLLPLLHSLLFVFTVVVQITGLWSVATTLEITERKVMHPIQHQTGTTERHYKNLSWYLAKFHKSRMVNPEIMTNLGPREKIHRDPRQADKSHNTQHKANAIIINFLIEIIGTMINQDRQDSMKSRINYIHLTTLSLHLHSLQDPTCLVTL